MWSKLSMVRISARKHENFSFLNVTAGEGRLVIMNFGDGREKTSLVQNELGILFNHSGAM